jgi:acetylornithine deacetylase/succinyl-diaminopimelate desuccinylase-like protein
MDALIDKLIELAITIQQIPAPTFHEQQRAEFVRQRFVEEGLANVEIDPAGNVYGRLAGNDKQRMTNDKTHPSLLIGRPSSVVRPVIVSAHLDTVFPHSVDLKTFRGPDSVAAPGIGDNATGVAGLFGLLWLLRERAIELPGDLWLVANACEEGLGDLRGMKAVVERFGEQPAAYIVLEGMALGQVFHRGLGVQRYRITVRTAGGHSWIDFGKPSAVHELTALASRITTLPVPATPRTTLNVGRITGGTSVNTIAPEASLELDLRSESVQSLQSLASQVESLVLAANKEGVQVEAEIIGQRPAGEIPASHPLVGLAQACLQEVGIQPRLNIGSTDANIPLSKGLPAVTIGLTHGSGAHTVHEHIEIAPLEKGLEQVVRLVSRVGIGDQGN